MIELSLCLCHVCLGVKVDSQQLTQWPAQEGPNKNGRKQTINLMGPYVLVMRNVRGT